MFRNLRFVTIVSFSIIFLSACSSVPDHAKYIPGDAVVVAGINTKEIGKKIAWNAILGSKLFDEMKARSGDSKMMADPEEMGIELMNTSYVFIKTDNRFANGNRITALIPLDNSGKWETYVKRTFPEAVVQSQQKQKYASLADGMYVGWNEDLLVVMNNLAAATDYMSEVEGDTTVLAPVPQVDNSMLIAEMDKTFNMRKENSILENDHFTKLEKESHDVSLWINYDVLMAQYGSKGLGDMVGIPLSGTLWKDAALAAGFDFEKGKINGDMLYYMPEELKEAGEAFGKTDADKEMIDRLPGGNLDMLMAWHLSPQGVKGMLEKMGMLGFINLALTTQNLSADFILETFTGDMVVAVNDFKITKVDIPVADTTGNITQMANYKSDMTYIYALKINKKENFNRLLSMAVANGSMQATGPTTYTIPSESSPAYVAVDDKYFVVSGAEAGATGFLKGSYKSDKMPEAAQKLHSNPLGFYFNAQGFMNTVDPSLATTPKDSAMIAESKKLLQDVVFTGGKFRNKAFSYNMAINFIDKKENSLLQLMNFAVKMSEARKEALVAGN